MIYKKLVLLAAICILLACNKEETQAPVPDSEDSPVQNETPTPEPKDDHIKAEGWQIPTLTSKTVREKKVISAKTASGKPVKVNSFTYSPRPPIVSQEPLKDRSLKIYSFTEFKVNDKVFCYEMEGYPISPKNNQTIGVNFVYRIWDLNGDSKFETLTFEKTLIVPDWVLK